MFRPLFLEHFHAIVRLGLAWSRVQPFLENNFPSSQLSVFGFQAPPLKSTYSPITIVEFPARWLCLKIAGKSDHDGRRTRRA